MNRDNIEPTCFVEIKTEILEAEDSDTVTDNDEKIYDDLTYDRKVKNEICQTDNFKPPTEYQTEGLDFNAAVSMCIQNQELSYNIEKIKCKKCSKMYSNEEDLKKHNCNHTTNLRTCDLSQRSFRTSTHLRNHKLVHTGEKPMNGKKRKRTRNTTTEQYEVYINFMANDETFRSGIINHTWEEDYIKKKWNELTALLNSCGDGPQMTGEDWKKRFADWKYAIRAKARKIIEKINRTGSSDIKLTSLEEKALLLWGKVVMTETSLINSFDGLPSHNETNEEAIPLEAPTVNTNNPIYADTETNSASITTENAELNYVHNVDDEHTSEIQDEESTAPKKKPEQRLRYRPKPFSALAKNLINTSENNVNIKALNITLNKFFDNYTKCKTEKNRLEYKKLKFEIAKYKFEHPDFDYEDSE